MAAARKPQVLAVLPDGSEKTFKGRYAWTLRQLVSAGSKGITPIERPAPRWSHYVMILRRAGITIETIDEKHDGIFAGTHGRYVLRDEIMLIDPDKTKPTTAATVRASNPNNSESNRRTSDAA